VSDELDHILTTARDWYAAGHRVALATVIDTWGSAPRRRGAHLVVRADGLFEGSVSGGCVEGDVISAAVDLLPRGGFIRLDYGVADAQAWEVGLACGGRISVLVQSLDEQHFPPVLINTILAARQAGTRTTLATSLSTGCTTEQGSGDFVTVYEPPLRLAIVGAVHIAQALVPLAVALGYEVRIVDPRGMFAAAERFAGLTVDPRWPDEALLDWGLGAASAVVTLTHDPKLDDPALIAALNSAAFYIGALGSRKTHAARLDRLRALGFDDAALARVHGPAGFDIGAANPPEIALSVAAQMVAAWRARG
jgi:xanthine dehydrogenase accessory factor